MLGRAVELKPPEHAARFGGESGAESGSGVGGEVIEDDADALGSSGKSTSDELAAAKGEVAEAVRRSVTLTLRQERWASTKTKRLIGRCGDTVVEALEPSGCGRDRLARFADELGWGFRSRGSIYGPLRVKLLGIEVEHILHAGDCTRRRTLGITTCPSAKA